MIAAIFSKAKTFLPRTTLLSAQRPIRRNKAAPKIKNWGAMTSVILFTLFINFRINPNYLHSFGPIRVAFIQNSELKLYLSPSHQSEISKWLSEEINKNPHQNLNALVAALQSTFLLQGVGIVRTGINDLVIDVHSPKPTIGVQLDKLRPANSLGQVLATTIAPDHLTIIKGLPYSSQSLGSLPNGTIDLSEETQLLVKEAILLKNLLEKRSLPTTELVFKEFRGFQFELKNGPEIFIGRRPFANRLDRLEELLNKLAIKGESISRIELDYKGKAFIKKSNSQISNANSQKRGVF